MFLELLSCDINEELYHPDFWT